MASASDDKTVFLWDVAMEEATIIGKCTSSLKEPINAKFKTHKDQIKSNTHLETKLDALQKQPVGASPPQRPAQLLDGEG